MRTAKLVMVALAVVALLGPPALAGADGNGRQSAENDRSPRAGNGGSFVLTFEPTAMLAPNPPDRWPTAMSPWPPNGTNASVDGMGATAWMVLNQSSGKTDLQFFVRGARPNTLYTVWTVFPALVWCTPNDSQAEWAAGCPSAFPVGSTKPGLGPRPAGFYPEAGVVAPTASMAKAFTSGMGLDPGATFYTNRNGDGTIRVRLDYNLLGTTYDDGPPVGNADVVAQCALPGIPAGPTYTNGGAPVTSSNCPPVPMRDVNGNPVYDSAGNPVTTVPRFTVTSSWLRKFIIQVPNPADPVAGCANYDPADPTSIFWQCIDPATVDPRTGTGLPRVWRFPFDHFRLAAHPDELTHGFIGGSAWEHTIDLVGRRCRIQPPLPGEPTC